MSDSVNTLASLVGGNAIAALIIDQLAIASWRGVPFYMKTGDGAVDPRVLRFLTPGSNKKQFQWLGPIDGPMQITGLVIGIDSVAQSEKMRQAFLSPGPGKLVHPWLGEIQAVLCEQARISFTEDEFGVARIEATFERYDPPVTPTPDWFGQLQDQVDGLMSQARSLLAGVLGAVAVPLAIYAYASSLLSTAIGVWDGLGLGTGGSAINAVVTTPVAAIANAAPTPGSATYADTIADLLAAPALALAQASQTQDAPAVAAATAPTSTDSAPDAFAAAAALLQGVAGFAPPPGASAPIGALCLAVQVQLVAQAAAVGATIDFDSAADATAWGAQLDATLATLQDQAATLCASEPLLVGPAWRALVAMRTTAAADIAARAVQLPQLLIVTTDRTMNAWRIALAYVGDTPDLMTSFVVDLWRRNPSIRNPAAVPPGTYSVLP